MHNFYKLLDFIYKPIFIPYALIQTVSWITDFFVAKGFLRNYFREFAVNTLPEAFNSPIVIVLDFLGAHSLFVSLTLLMLAVVYFYLFVSRKLASSRDAIKTITKISCEFNEFVSLVVEHLPNSGEVLTAESAQLIKVSGRDFIAHGTHRINKLLNQITRQTNHVSVKSFAKTGGVIKTLYRDVGDGRKDIDKQLESFYYKDNSAFREILENDEVSYFTSNNLKRDVEYTNLRDDYLEYYNKTIVIPISNQLLPNKIDENTVYGFVCVDSKKSKFEIITTVELLRNFAIKCYNVIDVLGRIEYMEKTNGGDENAKNFREVE